jgi:hypothetical protein
MGTGILGHEIHFQLLENHGRDNHHFIVREAHARAFVPSAAEPDEGVRMDAILFPTR